MVALFVHSIVADLHVYTVVALHGVLFVRFAPAAAGIASTTPVLAGDPVLSICKAPRELLDKSGGCSKRVSLSLSLYLYVYTCIYIYAYMSTILLVSMVFAVFSADMGGTIYTYI